MNILAVDDSKLIRSMLNNVLTSAGHTVTMACDGKEGADLAKKSKYDLVITDVKMPEMNGFELVKQLRSRAEYKTVPIIFLTGETEEEFKEKGSRSGASAWITKPFSPINLLETVASVSKRMNILVIDDSKLSRNMLNNVLSTAGYNVTMAADGKEGTELAANSKYDLVITDVYMAGMNGLELARQLRKTSEYEFTPIIFLTTETSEEFKAKGKEVGATDWITKPFSPIELLEVVDKI
ncbi:MAG: response regulator [Desulfuromonadaceae bacterium]|nr:response regulator [Desulfuromonadaceae bacterium]